MSLSQEQRALVQLLCERGQSYGDIAELLGISETEVRERTRATLRELGGADPDSDVELTDYLVGQADPITRADAVRHLQTDDEARELAHLITSKIAALAPNAKLPRIPEPAGSKPRQRSAARTRERRRPAATGKRSITTMEMGRARLIAGGVGSAIVLLFVILAVAGAFSSDGDGDSVDSGLESLRGVVAEELGIPPEEVTQEQLAEFDAQRDISPVSLAPVGGSGVAGRANFGTENTVLFVDLQLDGLRPDLPENSSYVLWLLVNDNQTPAGYPVTTITPRENGRVEDRYPIPAPVALQVAGAAEFVAITQTGNATLDGEIQTALDSGATFIPLTGKRLAQGEIPLVEPPAE